MSLLTLALLWPLRNLVFTGANDFLSYYAGARLVGTSDLYNPAKAQRVQLESAGASSQTLPFTRLPYFAAFLWPLGKLPYLAAYACWQILNGIAFLLFLRLWPLQPVWTARLLACACLGIGWSFANAQDHTFLLLWIAASLYLLRQEKPLAAGVVFALCAAKYHLFLLTPLILLRRTNWRFARGVLLGGGVLAAISFLAAGWDWPVVYARALLSANIHGKMTDAPNIHGLAYSLAWGMPGKLFCAAITTALVARIARRGTFETALGACLLGGYLISPHLFFHDTAILMPAALLSGVLSNSELSRILALLLILPIPLAEFILPFPEGMLISVAILALLAAMQREAAPES
ncbi:MAG: DUF2029 domain-containing protein [Acidobacteriia bacterium]|nr:DUF2029 domain-containing protein [Terriglobia bacterium]